MVGRREKDVILEHALVNEDNLNIALMIGAAFEELCGRVLVRFLDALKEKLVPRLGEKWDLTTKSDPVLIAAEYTEFVVGQYRDHSPSLQMVLAADEEGYPKRPYLAIRCHSPLAMQSTFIEMLKRVVDQEYGQGKATKWSVWYKYIDNAFSGWGSPDAQVRLYRKDAAITYFTEHMARLARVVEKALNPLSASQSAQ